MAITYRNTMVTKQFLQLIAAMVAGTCAMAHAGVAADYRLKPGDKVAITLAQAGQTRMQYELKLDQTGQFDLPLQSEVVRSCTLSASSKTAQELTTDVQGVLGRYEPGMTATVTVTSGGRSAAMATFCGEAKGVAFLEREVNTHVAAAVQFMGPSRFANLRKVTVNRLNPDGTTRTLKVDVEKIIRSGFQGDIALQAGDIVNVPASFLPVRKPVTDKVMVAANPLKLFCQMSHQPAVKPQAPAPEDSLDEPNPAPDRNQQVAAR